MTLIHDDLQKPPTNWNVMGHSKARRFPVISLGAEHLVIGRLMRRNILAYKAPPYNEGYDIICIHPVPSQVEKQVRVQVKSRYQTDCNRACSASGKTFDAFDYLVIVFMNIGYYYRKKLAPDGLAEPEIYVLPVALAHQHLIAGKTGWDKVDTRNQDLDAFKNDAGIEQIADELNIPYPS